MGRSAEGRWGTVVALDSRRRDLPPRRCRELRRLEVGRRSAERIVPDLHPDLCAADGRRRRHHPNLGRPEDAAGLTRGVARIGRGLTNAERLLDTEPMAPGAWNPEGDWTRSTFSGTVSSRRDRHSLSGELWNRFVLEATRSSRSTRIPLSFSGPLRLLTARRFVAELRRAAERLGRTLVAERRLVPRWVEFGRPGSGADAPVVTRGQRCGRRRRTGAGSYGPTAIPRRS